MAQKVKNQQYVKARLRFLATIVILSFSANIGAQIIYLGTLSGLSDIELGVEGKKNARDNCEKNPLQNIDCIEL